MMNDGVRDRALNLNVQRLDAVSPDMRATVCAVSAGSVQHLQDILKGIDRSAQ